MKEKQSIEQLRAISIIFLINKTWLGFLKVYLFLFWSYFVTARTKKAASAEMEAVGDNHVSRISSFSVKTIKSIWNLFLWIVMNEI